MAYPARCIVCGGKSFYHRPGGDPVCDRTECRFVAGEKGRLPAFEYARLLAERSMHIRERDRMAAARQEAMRLAQEKEDAENRGFWQAGHAAIPGYRAEKHPLLAVPQNRRKLTNLPERRKRAFRDKLNQLISVVTESSNAVYTGEIQPDPPPPIHAAKLLGAACALCKGACCLHGGDRAYLRDLTLVRVMQADPALRPRHLLDVYLSHLGKKTYENSCVYHGDKGCELTAELRSNVCSEYFCPPLKGFKQAFAEDEKPEGAFVVIRAREHWNFPEGVDNGIAGGFLLTEEGAEKLD